MKRLAVVAVGCLLMASGLFAQHTGLDRMFADTMTKHHQDGIKMSEMAVEKAVSAELRTMSHKAIEEQTREIAQLQSLRGDGPPTTPDEIQRMPGMMPESDMQRDLARLEAASGRAFDLAFTETMARHHAGAVKMSKHYLQHGQKAELKELAQKIADEQTAERQKLLAMHDSMDDPASMASSSGERQRMSKD